MDTEISGIVENANTVPNGAKMLMRSIHRADIDLVISLQRSR